MGKYDPKPTNTGGDFTDDEFNGAGLPSSSRGGFFGEGAHKVELQRLKRIVSKNPRTLGEIKYVIECVVLESTSEPPGSRRAQIVRKEGYNALEHLRQFFEFGAIPANAPEIDGVEPAWSVAYFDAAFGGDGAALEGLILGLDTEIVPTKSGGQFTIHTWRTAA